MMTLAQYKKKVKIARRIGEVEMNDGSKLIYHGHDWSAVDINGNTVDTTWSATGLAYLFVPSVSKHDKLWW